MMNYDIHDTHLVRVWAVRRNKIHTLDDWCRPEGEDRPTKVVDMKEYVLLF